MIQYISIFSLKEILAPMTKLSTKEALIRNPNSAIPNEKVYYVRMNSRNPMLQNEAITHHKQSPPLFSTSNLCLSVTP
jgi:hypothetical protein